MEKLTKLITYTDLKVLMNLDASLAVTEPNNYPSTKVIVAGICLSLRDQIERLKMLAKLSILRFAKKDADISLLGTDKNLSILDPEKYDDFVKHQEDLMNTEIMYETIDQDLLDLINEELKDIPVRISMEVLQILKVNN